MKKLLSIIISVLLLCSLMTGCSDTSITNSNKKINIVCTIYPQYDWVMNLLGDKSDNYNVTLLVGNGTDLHSYQPSAKDIINIKSCDLLIYVGGVSDQWVTELTNDADNRNMVSINMMEVLGDKAKIEEYVEGMEHSHDSSLLGIDDSHSHEENEHSQDEHSHTEDENYSHNHDYTEYDEHIWLSLRNANIICNAITSELCKLDSENTAMYNSALATYSEKLNTLDKQFTDTVATAKRTTLLFGDRFPFRYLTEDYGLDYYAAFAGCSAETEASFQTVVFLAEKTDELTLPGICITESTDQSLAKTIIENTKYKNQTIYEFNSMQSVTDSDIKKGTTYLSIMEDNLEVLKTALN